MKVFIAPKFKGNEYGGIARVVAAQKQWLPSYDCEVVETREEADVLACHATTWIEPQNQQKLVTHCHGLYWTNYQWPRWALAVNNEVCDVLRKADVITAPSEWVANSIRRGTNRQVHVIGHGVNIEEWTAEPHNNYVLWDKTRSDPVCDPRAVNVIANKMPNVRFVTSIGEQTQNVDVVGIQDYEDHKPYLQHATLYLCTARETFGIGTLEALACGVPVVGWDWGGQSDIVNRDVGWLSPLGDYDDLAIGIRYCLENREQLSKNARHLIEQKYQWHDVIKQYADLYENLMKSDAGPKVSVIMPSYNLKEYLPKAVESIMAQTYEDYELIIVDDCSTDGSATVAADLARQYEPKIRIFKTPTNQYLAGALNYGIERSYGEFILPLDPDNSIMPNTLEILVGELDKDKNKDIVYGRVRFINEDGTPYQSQITDSDGVSRWPPDVFNYEMQMSHRNQIPSTSLYRRSIWERIGGYRRRCRTAEDADFWCRATTYGARAYKVTDLVTLVYTVRSNSMSHTNDDWPWEAWYTNVRSFLAPNNVSVEVPDPIVSVVIPVGPTHNTWLPDALDSLLNQTFKDWEALVIDDSHDLTNLPPWIRYYKTPNAGSGVSIARNIGIRQAHGSCFVLLDADDFLDPEALEKMYSAYRHHGGYVYSDWRKPETQTLVKIEGTCKDLINSLIHPITCLYPIEVRNHVKFDETLTYGEDWDYILQIIDAGWCGTYVPDGLLYYRQGYGSNRFSLKDNIIEVRQLMQERHMAGCGCGRGGGGVAQQVQHSAMQMSNDLVLIEYTHPDSANITYRGPKTGTEYRFGNNEGHRLGYVHTTDLEWFINRNEFRLADMVPVS